ncbi:mannose-1-phosphate guanylyltransferase [Clostridium cellulovorans]|uniref:mannose-1-phosphate guanylyltransferase n=1 Tax=Clostridium cellulovorans (strain ATCC 35296 / DSM 3052 / OCM 3 / 743B) TaxID=573061 RepID=D9SR43_CLOC7|nr:mannose-1-phosphate guanylyltransferase [Clostridium cellulovorans]ADL50331.1 Mannose-1-phosphate guanylyltransferase [Clostridium cellulovorans 743B]
MLCALIMAGGKGTRFWPLSTEEKPKQFLKLLGNETMIQMTVNRLKKLIPIERIFVVTGEMYLNILKEQLPELPQENIILEPVGRNTAPCIALSAFRIKKHYEDATIAVLPADHLIENIDRFLHSLDIANRFIHEKPEAIVTLGMKPTRPEVGYGYIKCEKNSRYIDEIEIRKVQAFVEKPNFIKALEYIQTGEYLWNGGMFIWKSDNILELTKKHLDKTYEILKYIDSQPEGDYLNTLKEMYPQVANISVDYGIMEKSQDIYVIPSEFGWDDIGTWASVERYREKDELNNLIDGNIKIINSQNNLIIGSKKPVIVKGLDDIYFIETDDMIIIGKKEEINEIKELKNIIE